MSTGAGGRIRLSRANGRRIERRRDRISGHGVVRAIERHHHLIAFQLGVIVIQRLGGRPLQNVTIQIELRAVAGAIELRMVSIVVHFAVAMGALNIDRREHIRLDMDDQDISVQVIEFKVVRAAHGLQVRIVRQVDRDFSDILSNATVRARTC